MSTMPVNLMRMQVQIPNICYAYKQGSATLHSCMRTHKHARPPARPAHAPAAAVQLHAAGGPQAVQLVQSQIHQWSQVPGEVDLNAAAKAVQLAPALRTSLARRSLPATAGRLAQGQEAGWVRQAFGPAGDSMCKAAEESAGHASLEHLSTPQAALTTLVWQQVCLPLPPPLLLHPAGARLPSSHRRLPHLPPYWRQPECALLPSLPPASGELPASLACFGRRLFGSLQQSKQMTFGGIVKTGQRPGWRLAAGQRQATGDSSGLACRQRKGAWSCAQQCLEQQHTEQCTASRS